jgi:hypothetical protein
MRACQPQIEVTVLGHVAYGDLRPGIHNWKTNDVNMVDLSVRQENRTVGFRDLDRIRLWREVEFGIEIGRVRRERVMGMKLYRKWETK